MTEPTCWMCAKFQLKVPATQFHEVKFKRLNKEYKEKYHLCRFCWNHVIQMQMRHPVEEYGFEGVEVLSRTI